MADALAGEITRRQELLRAAGNLVGRHRVRGGSPVRRGRPAAAAGAARRRRRVLRAARRSGPSCSSCSSRSDGSGRSLGLHLLLASQRLDEGGCAGWSRTCRTGSRCARSRRRSRGPCSACPTRTSCRPRPARRSCPPAPTSWSGSGPRTCPGPADGAAPRPGPGRAPGAYPFEIAPGAAPPDARRPPDRADERPHRRCSRPSSPTSPGSGRPRTGCGCRRWTTRRRSTSWSAPCARSRGAGWPRRAGAGSAAGARRARRPALPAAPRPAAGRPRRCRRAPRRRRRAAVGQVDAPLVDRCCWRSRCTHTPDSWALTCSTSGARRSPRSPGCRTSAPSPTASTPTWCAASSPRSRPLLTRRERLFRDARDHLGRGVPGPPGGRARSPTSPTTDLLLVVDGYLTLRSDFEDLEARLLPLVAQGLSYGVHLAVTADRWSELRPAIKDLVGGRLELRLGEPSESEIDRRGRPSVPARGGPRAGRRRRRDGAGRAPPARRRHGGPDRADRGAGRPGAGCAPVRLLPDRSTSTDLPDPGPGSTGDPDRASTRSALALVQLDVAAEPHLRRFADAESGKTALLRLLARGIVDAVPARARPGSSSSTTGAPARRGPRHPPDRLHQHARRGRRRRDRGGAGRCAGGCPAPT